MKTTFVLLSVCLSIVAGCSFWRYANWIRPRRGFEQLLAGNDRLRITSLLLEGEIGRAVIDDLATTEYLTQAFRSAVPDRAEGGGMSYDATISLSSGGSVRCYIVFRGGQGEISVSEPIDVWLANDPFDFYLIRLPDPIPQRLLEAMPRLAGNSR
jgi:hypothetical protein